MSMLNRDLKSVSPQVSHFASSDNSISTNPTQANSDEYVKPPFLPRLPEKLFTNRLETSHLINGYYLDILKFNNNNSKKKQKIKPLLLNENSKPLTFNGDLLKASQICLFLETTVSESLKHVKTADTPWIRSVNETSVKSAKPLKSALSKHKPEVSSFERPKTNENFQRVRSKSSLVTSTSNNNRNHRPVSHLKTKSVLQEYLRTKTISNLETSSRCYSNIQQYAEDLLADHINKSFQEQLQQTNLSKQPDIALNALDTIWELHKHIFAESSCLAQILNEQLKLQTPEYKKTVQTTKSFIKMNIGAEKFEKMTYLILDISDPFINKHSLACALGNLYHKESIEVPGRLVAGVLAAAYLLNFDLLKQATVEKMSHSINRKIVSDCYKVAYRNKNIKAIEICESWLEIHLIPHLSTTIYLKNLPLEILTKTVKSKRLFTTNEYSVLITVLYWIFFYLNPKETETPTESIMSTYFSSLSKESSLVEKYPEFKPVLNAIRLYGISNSNQIVSIQHMNIYPHSHLVKIMLEIQQSLYHGGDMNIYRVFETSAVRHGFTIDINQNYCSEVFSLYGFHFELVAEKVLTEEFSTTANVHQFKFYIQRLTSKDPVLTYEQSQLEMFSLRNDRFCTYSITVQYWHEGKQVIKSTGEQQQHFGKSKSQLSSVFDVELDMNDLNNKENHQEVLKEKELMVMYSFTFPVD